MKYTSPFNAVEETGKIAPYYQQFKAAVPDIGMVYKVTGSGIITKNVKILAIVEGVAIGKVIWDDNGTLCAGEMRMYHTEGYQAGWQYRENRPGYRLQELT